MFVKKIFSELKTKKNRSFACVFTNSPTMYMYLIFPSKINMGWRNHFQFNKSYLSHNINKIINLYLLQPNKFLKNKAQICSIFSHNTFSEQVRQLWFFFLYRNNLQMVSQIYIMKCL